MSKVTNTTRRVSNTGFIGVHRHSLGSKYNLKKPFFVRVQAAGIEHHFGSFADAKEAAKFRDRKAYQLLGLRAVLNFPT